MSSSLSLQFYFFFFFFNDTATTEIYTLSLHDALPISLDQRRIHQEPTGVTADSSVSPVLIRTTCSSATTKIFPSPTSPVRAPSQIASTVGCTNSSETPISKRTLSVTSTLTVLPR